MFSEIPRLPAFLLLNWPPMSGSFTPGSGPVAASRAARPPIGGHGGEAGVGVVLPLHLVAFGAHRGEEARAAGGGQEPGEIEDFHALQRERLAVQRGFHRAAVALRLRRHRRASGLLGQDRLRCPRPAAGRGGRPASLSSWSAICWWDSRTNGRVPDDRRRRTICAGSSARRAHFRAACGSAPTAARPPAPPATACPA